MDEVVERVRRTETQEATMYVAGIDAHATYVVVAIVSKTGELVKKAPRVANTEARELLEILELYRPLEAVVETSPGIHAELHAVGLRLERLARRCGVRTERLRRWARSR